ncbi:MAG: aminoglycoside phosphotransferase family protein [Planctomycetales bacterium]|nr:aminoglycoside phosphotransferase family protein [Planctomycetales bacterium]
MSGAELFRCDGAQPLVLRCWPSGTPVDRVRQIHAVVVPLAKTCDRIAKYRAVAGSNQTFAIDGSGMIWDLATWMPGQPLGYDAPLESIGAGAAAIGEAHESLRRIASSHGSAPALTERIDRLKWLNQHLPSCFGANLGDRVHPSLVAPLEAARRQLQSNWTAVTPTIATDLRHWAARELPLQYVFRDVHREHLLFTSGSVSGIIDYDAIRIDTPATDLARWATSFAAFSTNPGQVIRQVLAGYLHERPLKDAFNGGSVDINSSTGIGIGSGFGPINLNAPTSDFRTLVLTIAESSLWISLANWVIWLVGQTRQFPDFQRVAERLSRLIESTDALPKR